MKRIAILGSTGSIGMNVLEVVRRLPGQFEVAALSAHSNTGLLSAQAREFCPKLICVTDEKSGRRWKPGLKTRPKIFLGAGGLLEMVEDRRIDMVVMAVSGASALLPLLKAIGSGKEIATANKEALVMAGPLVTRLAVRNNVKIIPIDSEQSAIWQCLEKEDRSKLSKIYLTASGGPFRRTAKAGLKSITVKDALAHPRWKMGRKITIDSATLMNKGLEVLEAMCLFAVEADKVEVLIHPESIIHSMVEFVDSVVMAQLSVTDMRIPIQYAMTYPRRLTNGIRGVDFVKLKSLNFSKPDFTRFPCLGLAYEAARAGGSVPCVLNAANEVSVKAFLDSRVDFLSIPELIGKVMKLHRKVPEPSLGDILEADSWARAKTAELIAK
jgi:1-deoxy-D-xylulose-5-phosphate reductoisomerase